MSDSHRAVFLSYAHEDAPAAGRICDALRAAGVEVWFDQSELRGGDAWDQKIRRRIKDCALFVPIISANTQARLEGYFRLEWRLAEQRSHLMAKGRPFLLPAVIDDTRDSEAHVPDSFLEVQWTRIPGGESNGLFCARVKALLDGDATPLGAAAAGGQSTATAPAEAAASAADRTVPKSIAVLAFANMSHDPENEYFSDGISEELLNVLAKVPGLRVTARTSSFHFKGRNLPIRQIARELGVTHVVEGSVRKAGNRVRITAQLIDAAEDAHLWSDSFDRELRDIFAVQDEIAGVIAKNLQLKLGASARVAKTVNPEAHRLVLEGWYILNHRTRESDARAEAAFRKAIIADPDFADAHAGLAAVASGRLVFRTYDGLPTNSEYEQLLSPARRALELDPANVAAYAVLGHAFEIARRWDESEEAYRHALAINPNDVWTRMFHYGLLAARGRLDAALSELQYASALDPLNFVALSRCAVFLHRAGRVEQAVAYNEHVLGLNPNWVAEVATRAVLLLAADRKSDAIAASRQVRAAREAWPRVAADPTAIWVLRNAGATDEAADYAREFVAPLAAENYLRGFALTAVDRFAEALPALEHTPSHLFQSLYWDAMWDAYRDDSRFRQLLVKLGCAEEYKVAREMQARMKREQAAKK